MKKFLLVFFAILLTVSIGWGSSVNAESSSDGESWVDNTAKIKPHVFDYLEENAGIASYIYTERDLDLDKAEEELFTSDLDIDKKENDFLVGTENETFNKILVTKDGLIVSFVSKDWAMKGLFDDKLPLDDALKVAVEHLAGPSLDDFNHVNFQHMDAERFFTAPVPPYKPARDLTIPDNAEILEFTGNSNLSTGKSETLDTNKLQPGKTHSVTAKEIPSKIVLDDEIISEERGMADFITITSLGDSISIDGKGATGAAKEANITLENKFQITFTDVDQDNVHFEGITSLADQGIISGYEDATFKPWNDIARKHVAIILYQASDLNAPSDINDILNVYEDVDSNTYYADEIAAVTKADIFSGSNGYFSPDEPITREQMATVLVSGLDLDEYDAGDHADINLDNVSPSHEENVQVLADLDITNQLDDFKPGEKISRAAFSTFLNESLKVVDKK